MQISLLYQGHDIDDATEVLFIMVFQQTLIVKKKLSSLHSLSK